MKTRHTITAALVAALAGCANLDRLPASDFVATGERTFQYRTGQAAMLYDESTRMQWLETWLADNSMCAGGYEITERQEVKAQYGTVRIHYVGRCT